MSTPPNPGRNPKMRCPTGVAAPLVKGSAAVRQREALAVDLRAEGLTYREVGERLGITRQMATRVVKRGLATLVRESAAELLALDNERVDMVWRAMWPHARAGSAPHAMVCLKALERRARLFGLDAPARSEVTAHITAEETAALDKEIEALLVTYGIGEGSDDDGGEGSGDDGP
jgi:hypothetical protein